MDEMDVVLWLGMLASFDVCVDDADAGVSDWPAHGFDRCSSRHTVCLDILKLGGDFILGSA
ncbi:MAG: hypothetical protein NTX82_07525 [Candidatus Parcubacteria bacterium]|nr:hypothetical protein [Candidatus Parcubacteria bacterium]